MKVQRAKILLEIIRETSTITAYDDPRSNISTIIIGSVAIELRPVTSKLFSFCS